MHTFVSFLDTTWKIKIYLSILVLLKMKIKGRTDFLLNVNAKAVENKWGTEHYKSKKGTVQVITS